MLTLRTIKALLLSMLLMAGAAFADQKYVTDLKYVNLYTKPNKNSETLMYLPSGAKVKVVYQGQHFAKVKTSEGVTGWISAGHLDPAKPALIKQLEIKKELDEAKQMLLRERKQHMQQVERLEGDIARQRAAIAAKPGARPPLICPPVTRKECPAVAANVAANTANGISSNPSASNIAPQNGAEKSSIVSSLTNPVVLGVIGGVFLLSFLLAWLFFDWRRRRRYGGFRI